MPFNYFEAPMDCKTLNCSLFSLCLNLALVYVCVCVCSILFRKELAPRAFL
uniref:Uncharacterized protein n=1 Tax=Octopus bimaculoides TaxID=37653 RepID=A0A0L8GID4_OCTBM